MSVPFAFVRSRELLATDSEPLLSSQVCNATQILRGESKAWNKELLVRRLGLLEWAVAAISFAIAVSFAFLGAPRIAAQSHLPTADAAHPVVAAHDVTARALAVRSGPSSRQLLVVAADRPNRVLSLSRAETLDALIGSGITGSLGDGGAERVRAGVEQPRWRPPR